MAKWNKITEEKPKDDQMVLVSARGNFLVSRTNFYSKDQRDEYASWVHNPPTWMKEFSVKDQNHYLECEGYFEEFGQKYYFDDPEVYWQPLPRPPGKDLGSQYWEDQKVQPDFNTWMENLHASIMCNCGHGCRSWMEDNGTKAYKIIEALLPADPADLSDLPTLNAIVQKTTDDVGLEIWNERMKRNDDENPT